MPEMQALETTMGEVFMPIASAMLRALAAREISALPICSMFPFVVEDKACFGRYFNALDGLLSGLYCYFVKEGCAGESVPFKETAAAAFTRRFEHLLYGVS